MNEKVEPQRPFDHILQPILAQSARRHHHLCPRQVLGARIGLYGLKQLGLMDKAYRSQFKNSEKRLLTIVETDGCGADGVAVATDCHVGRRTLRVLDFGKVAATLIDTYTEQAIRIWPAPQSRAYAEMAASTAVSKWQAYLEGYQILSDAVLLCARPITLTQSIRSLLSQPNMRALCELCQEEIMNEREVSLNGRTLCRACAGESYYT